MKIIAANKKAIHDYFIKEKYESGIVLTGPEVKSLRINTGSIKESYIQEKNGELWLTNCFIKKYLSSNDPENNPTRERKLLITKKELNKVKGAVKKEGFSIIPINLVSIIGGNIFKIFGPFSKSHKIGPGYSIKVLIAFGKSVLFVTFIDFIPYAFANCTKFGIPSFILECEKRSP